MNAKRPGLNTRHPLAALVACTIGVLGVPGTARAASLDDPVPQVRWSGVPFRRTLERAGDGLNLGLVLDRRIDPSRPVELALTNTTGRGVYERLAAGAGGAFRVVGRTVYVGPPAAATPLRTLIRLRTDEGLARFRSDPRVTRRRTTKWPRLARPAAIVEQIGREFEIPIAGVEALPHDLWERAELPEATFAEALSLVLIQFDRTFEWTDEGVRLVPIPETVGIEKLHTVRGGTAAAAVAAWRTRFPKAKIELAGRRLRMFALLEDHEAAQAAPRAGGNNGNGPPPAVAKIDDQRYTLRVKGAPASALMKRLEQTGLKFAYDAQALKTAGVDLDMRIELDVQDATTDELLRATFEPLGLSVSRTGANVRLQPKSR